MAANFRLAEAFDSDLDLSEELVVIIKLKDDTISLIADASKGQWLRGAKHTLS